MMRAALMASSLAIGACAAAQAHACRFPLRSGGGRWPLAGGDEAAFPAILPSRRGSTRCSRG